MDELFGGSSNISTLNLSKDFAISPYIPSKLDLALSINNNPLFPSSKLVKIV